MRFWFLLLTFFFSLISLNVLKAQTTLPPGSTTFEVSNIILTPVDDYTLTKQRIGLFGNKSYLLVAWNATYEKGLEREIRVNCFLNCEDPWNLTTCPGRQNCSYSGLAGYAECSILFPKYFYNQSNYVTCHFYDPFNPATNFTKAREFKVINYTLHLQIQKLTFNLGEKQTLPISLTNFGLLANSFTVNVSLNFAEYPTILIFQNYTQTEKVRYGETTVAYPQIVFLSDQEAVFLIQVKNNQDEFECNNDEDCSYLNQDGISGFCNLVDHRCWKQTTITIKAGKLVLNDFSLYQILILIGLTLPTFYLIQKRFK